jgi:tRNA pseudouridine55 synthase
MAKTSGGLLVIDKPEGMTSRAVVNQVQQWFPPGVKIGHTGTLDPLATGVLVLCVGRATRLADYVQQMEKTYQARFRLGAVSDTDDAQGVITLREGVTPLTREQVFETLQGFVGEIWQRPPTFSALKLQGQRAYALARQGTAPTLAPRLVHIRAIRLLDYQWPYVEVEVDCGRGTYIRALARDVGEKLGCGGYVEALRRVRVGPFTLAQASPLHRHQEPPPLLPARLAVSHLPQLTLAEADAQRFRHGQIIFWQGGTAADTPGSRNDPEWAVLDQHGNLLGIGRRVGESLRPWIVL